MSVRPTKLVRGLPRIVLQLMLRWTRFALVMLAVGCAHRSQAARPQPTNDQFGCYRVALRRPLHTLFPVPKWLELRADRSQCAFARDDFVALADEPAGRRHAHGHWWREDEKHIRVVWGGDFYGVTFDFRDRDLHGVAVTFQDVGDESDRTEVALVRVACSPSGSSRAAGAL
jgi:hypothetical protein